MHYDMLEMLARTRVSDFLADAERSRLVRSAQSGRARREDRSAPGGRVVPAVIRSALLGTPWRRGRPAAAATPPPDHD